ncbi:MAG: Gfo/Idh/MocA family oxidoreductase [Candidatus Lindowbacteria bacterium]|nr:Gfo/Idh/MocA family oxidoreductase [Candidatus Lindowbacteria bacterium]
MRVGIIGFGKMGMLHAGIVNAMADHEVVAIAEPAKLIGSTIGLLQPNIKVYEDYKKMLDEAQLDAAIITTPVHMHVDMALGCVEAGVPFFLEKPMCLSAEQAEPLVKALKEKPVINGVMWMMRYIETFRTAREIFDTGALGKIINFNITMYVSQLFKPGKGWRYDKSKSGGGVIMGPTSHSIDLIYAFFGPMAGVNAYQINHYSKTTEDFIHILFKTKDGVTGFLDSSWSVRGHRMVETTLKIHGENGMLIVTDDGVRVLLDKEHGTYPEGWTVIQKPEVFQGVEFDIGGAQYTAENAAFLEAIAENKELDHTAHDGYEVHRIIDAVYESAANNGNYVEL